VTGSEVGGEGVGSDGVTTSLYTVTPSLVHSVTSAHRHFVTHSLGHFCYAASFGALGGSTTLAVIAPPLVMPNLTTNVAATPTPAERVA
jgi:hypothetical protein